MTMDWGAIAAELMKHPTMKATTWNTFTLAAWLRDGCCCVYCGNDMLASYDVTYYDSALDHLLPLSKYQELDSVLWNRVLSCSTCNSMKAAWDPNFDGIYIAGSIVLEETARRSLLQRARERVQELRRARVELYAAERRLIWEQLSRAATAASGR
jgi:hypothetical protein